MRYVCSKCGQPARDGIPLRHYNGVATCAQCEPKLPEGPARMTKPDEEPTPPMPPEASWLDRVMGTDKSKSS